MTRPPGSLVDAPVQRRCEQCGRIGTRGFEWLHVEHAGISYGDIIQCANRRACAKRYERTRPLSWLDD